MVTDRQRRALMEAGCEVHFDRLTRTLYATDASHYQIEPWAVAFPRSANEASAVIRAAADANVPIIPRGAGTGLAGGAIGEGLIVEFARFNRGISDLDLERRSVRVGAGVVLDQLNAFLKPHGYCFGPDVATSSRATLGGMIANNSSGSHVPVYGTTADHVLSLEIVLADGRIETAEPGQDTLAPQRRLLDRLVETHAAEIAKQMPAGLLKRWSGYGLNRALREPGNLINVLSGSEGTLAAISSAELRISPLPRRKALALIFFASVTEAMQATVELAELRPAAIEHVDRVLLDQTRGQLAFKAARDLLQLDEKPCESILLVEFYDDTDDKPAAVAQRALGLRTDVLRTPAEMNLVWSMRKAGLALLTGRKGAAKPVTGIEDAAVRPEQLPEYVASLQKILKPLAAETCFYGHASTGLLHVRPVLDLHRPADLKAFRTIAADVSALVKQFKGSLAAEHGVGIARTEFMPEQVGQVLLDVMWEIKRSFDPQGVFNPGKIFDATAFKIDALLRPDLRSMEIPFEPVLAFAAKDESFVGNLEQCNGCGGCRKESPTMCPTFLVTGDEVMSTRGRANVIRAALEAREADGALASAELDEALSSCLSCKACTAECPSNVNMALLKAELLHARFRRDGLPWRERLLSSVDSIGKLGTAAPGLANAALRFVPLRQLMDRLLAISQRRPMPLFAAQRFNSWFYQRPFRRSELRRRKVLLWDDTFVRYYEPHIGKAAVQVLEAAGFEVELVRGRACCGRPAFSQGNLGDAASCARRNIQLLLESRDPVIFLEPSCYSMFVEDYRELKIVGAEAVADRCRLFETFIDQILAQDSDALRFNPASQQAVIHVHCHAKSLLNPSFMAPLAARVCAQGARLLDTGCCGMAGAFGMVSDKYDLSVKVAAPLISQLKQQTPNTVVVASGASCRHQIEDLATTKPLHMAELLAHCLSPRIEA